MQIVAKCLVWIGFLGMWRVVMLTRYFLNASEPSRNRAVILSSFFPCVAMTGIWLLRRPPMSIRIIGWTMVVILQLETCGALVGGLFLNDFVGDDQFRIAYLCVTLPIIMCAGWLLMWRISNRPEL